MGLKRCQILCVFIFCLFSSGTVFAFDMSSDDKQRHFAVSNAIAGPTYLTMRSQKYSKLQSAVMAIAVTMAVGHAKENQDRRYDVGDMGANAVGAMSGIMLPLHISF